MQKTIENGMGIGNMIALGFVRFRVLKSQAPLTGIFSPSWSFVGSSGNPSVIHICPFSE